MDGGARLVAGPIVRREVPPTYSANEVLVMARYQGRHRKRFFESMGSRSYAGKHQAPNPEGREYKGRHRGEYVGVHRYPDPAGTQVDTKGTYLSHFRLSEAT